MNWFKFLIYCLVISCSAPGNGNKQSSGIDTMITRISKVVKKDSTKIHTTNFNHTLFFSMADSLINKIVNEKTDLNCSVDTIKIDAGYKKFNGINNTSYTRFKPSAKTTVIYYTLFPGVKRYFLHLSIIRVIYSDSAELNQDFRTLKMDAYGLKTGPPGLTYTNDYVIKTKNQLVWLNMPCTYDGNNSKKVIRLLRRSLNVDEVTDSIICKCGMSVCK